MELDKWTIWHIVNMLHPIETTSLRLVSKRFRRLISPPLRMTPNELLLDGARCGRLEIIQVALTKGATNRLKGIKYLAKFGQWNALSTILEVRSASDKSIYTAIKGAAQGGWLDNMKELIEWSSRAYDGEILDGQLIMRAAISKGQYHIVQYLVGLGVISPSDYGTILGTSLRYGQIEVAKKVLKEGALLSYNDALMAGMSGSIETCNFAYSLIRNSTIDQASMNDTLMSSMLTGAVHSCNPELCRMIMEWIKKDFISWHSEESAKKCIQYNTYRMNPISIEMLLFVADWDKDHAEQFIKVATSVDDPNLCILVWLLSLKIASARSESVVEWKRTMLCKMIDGVKYGRPGAPPQYTEEEAEERKRTSRVYRLACQISLSNGGLVLGRNSKDILDLQSA